MIYQEIDDVKFKMGKQFDFDFLRKYGKVLRYMTTKIQEISVSEQKTKAEKYL